MDHNTAVAAEMSRLARMPLADVLSDLPPPFRGAAAAVIASACRARVAKEARAVSPTIGANLPLLPAQRALQARIDAARGVSCG